MHYLVDGYNLFFFFHSSLQFFDEFLHDMDQLAKEKNLHATFFFDRKEIPKNILPKWKKLSHIEIIYAPFDQCADQFIFEWLRNKKRKEYIICSNDRWIIREAVSHHIRHISLKTFIKRLQKNPQATREKPQQISARDLQRYLEIFDEDA